MTREMETWRDIWVNPDQEAFTVKDYRDDQLFEEDRDLGIIVSLPHQCSEWEIVAHAPTPAAAAEVLADFIAEAQKTLVELEEMT